MCAVDIERRFGLIDISKKRLPAPVVGIFVYLTYCAMSWFSMRGTLALYAGKAKLPAWFANDVWAFFIGGLLPFLIYGLASMFVFKMLPVKTNGGNIKSLRNGLDYAVITANVLLFLLKFIYIAVPLYAPVLEIILNPTVTVAVVALYMWYAFYMNYVDKSRYHVVLTQVFGMFTVVYGLVALVNTIMAVA